MIVLPLNPITAMLTGALLLAEPVSIELLAGLALVIIGIMLVVGLPGGVGSKRAAAGTRPP